MRSEILIFKDEDGKNISYYKWSPGDGNIKGMIQISHGLSETAGRYERFAEFLTDRGYLVYANDHRGHGKTAGSIDNLGYAGEDGISWIVRDMKQLNDIAKAENPGMPVFLFGHSMGSHKVQRYIQLYGDSIKGAILSGTSGKQGLLLEFGISLSKIGAKRKGPKERAYLINKLTFGAYNMGFEPCRTDFDWLSRDSGEVDKYINDPYCGAVSTYSFFKDYLSMLKALYKKGEMENIPVELPIYLFSGDKDPVGNNTKSVLNLVNMYKSLGIRDVSYKFYKDGRHEMLNEINREEVMLDIINWIEAHMH